MERVSVEAPARPGAGVDRLGLSRALGTTDVAVNHYRIAPGEGLPGGLHAHADQEEVFLVLEGEATFEVYEPRCGPGPASGEVVVAAGEAVRFAPGEFQSGRNDSAEDLAVLAVGAPRDSEDVRLPVDCPACGHSEMRMDADDGLKLVCPDCGTERVPAPCPECGDEDLRVALVDRVGGTDSDDGGGGTAVVCPGCGATFEGPPFRA